MGLRQWLAAEDRPRDAIAAPSAHVGRLPRGATQLLRQRAGGTPLAVAQINLPADAVSRDVALTVPTVLACRDLIVGTVVQLSLYRYRAGERLPADYLTSRPDPSTTIAATMGGTIDDLVFYGRAYWRVLDRDAEGVVRRARWTPVSDVTPQTRHGGGAYAELLAYRVAGEEKLVPISDMIRFDSPLPGVLDVGGRTLQSAIELELAARRFASVELPAGTLKNEGTEVGQAEAAEIVASFQTARRENGIAFLQGVAYSREDLSPADLQLIEARANAATDIARLFNIPVAMVGASPSGNASALLYSNLSQQLAIMVSSAVAPHLRTVELTLSDVYPRGTSIAFDVQTFLRSDPQAAADYAIALLGAEIIDQAEARSLLGIPSAPAPVADLTPGRV